MVLRQQQREENYRRKKGEQNKDPKMAVRVSSISYIHWYFPDWKTSFQIITFHFKPEKID